MSDLKTKKTFFRIPLSWFLITLLPLIAILGIIISWKSFDTIWFGNKEAEENSIVVLGALHSENTLGVLSQKNTETYSVNYPATYYFLGKEVNISPLEKKVEVTYNYTIHFGIDLKEVRLADIKVDNNSVSIRLPKPIETSIEITDDFPKTSGSFLINKSKPREDIEQYQSNYGSYVYILRSNALATLKETGKYEELQNKAMDNAQENVTSLVKSLLNKEGMQISVEFY